MSCNASLSDSAFVVQPARALQDLMSRHIEAAVFFTESRKRLQCKQYQGTRKAHGQRGVSRFA